MSQHRNDCIAMDFDPNRVSGQGQPCDHQPTPTLSLVQHSLQGRYLLAKELGRGGFGTAYLATDNQLAGRNVVVKVLFPSSVPKTPGL